MLSSISKATHGGSLLASSHRAASLMRMSRSCRYHQAAILSYNNYFRGFSSQAETAAAVPIASSMINRGLCFNNLKCTNLLHRSFGSSSSGGRSNNYHHQSNYFKQQGHRAFLEIALFSSALYGAATSIVSAASTNESTTLCSNSNNSSEDSDEDFLSKITSKINSQSLSNISLPTSLDEALATIGSQTQLALNSGIPTNLSYGFFAGYMSGFALKKIGRVASLTFGVGFVLLQTLAYHGYIDVNHDKLAKEIEGVLDRNGDGVVDGEDLKGVVDELRRVVGFGIEGSEEGDGGRNDQVKAIAGGGGFGMGFLGGLRSG